jgi:hypothetical protein
VCGEVIAAAIKCQRSVFVWGVSFLWFVPVMPYRKKDFLMGSEQGGSDRVVDGMFTDFFVKQLSFRGSLPVGEGRRTSFADRFQNQNICTS